MRPRMLWLTSTLSTLSRLISKVRRLMNPVLWTTRRLVTSVSVVQRWNQAFTVQYSRRQRRHGRGRQAQQDEAFGDGRPRQQEQDSGRDPGHDRRQIEDPVRVGRIQHLLAGLQDFVDITPHTLASITPAATVSVRCRRRPEPVACRTAPLCIRAFWLARSVLRRSHYLTFQGMHQSSWAGS